MYLVRKMLSALIDHPSGYAPRTFTVDGYSEEQIGYHAYLMHQAGLVKADDATTGECTGPMWEIVSITNAGHDFAEAAKNDSIWDATKKKAKEKGLELGDIGFGVLTEFLKQQLRHHLGLS